MKNRNISLALLLTMLSVACVADEKASPTSTPINYPAPGIGNTVIPVTLLTSREFWLSFIVLMFGLIVLIFQYLLFKKLIASANDVTKSFILTLIVVGVLFSITAGFSAQTVAPAVGLFGTIAGYLLGRREENARPQDEK